MPLTPSGARTFLLALSDFWATFFKDRELLGAYADAMSLDAAQLYQAFLETALGLSLRDAPLYDRTFFQAASLREDQMTFREGEAPDADTFDVYVRDGLVNAEYVTNRILAPTSFLTEGRDFTVDNGALRFRANPFNDDRDSAFTYFPVRTVTVASPAAWTDPLSRAWVGAQPGDIVRVTVGATVSEAQLAGVRGPTLHLRTALQAADLLVARRGAEVVVLRTPYDGRVVGKRLPAHPRDVFRVTQGASDAATVDGTSELDLSAEPSYDGSWAPGTAYGEGSLVDNAGSLWRSREAHTSAVSFEAHRWEALSEGYFYVTCESAPRLDGIYRATTATGPGRVAVAISAPYTGTLRVTLHRVTYPTTVAGDQPRILLSHTYVTPSSLSLDGRRAVARKVVNADGSVTVHAAGGPLVEGVDYVLNGDDGSLTVLSAWNPSYVGRATYEWRLLVARRSYRWRGPYATATGYSEGDLVQNATTVLVVTATHTSDGVLDARYLPLKEPASSDEPWQVREIGAWVTDALIDTERLYRNFGYLLDRPRATSEAYRAFLLAVSRLFLLGPTFDRFESALNAVTNLPLIRDDGEVLREYSDGVAASGTDGLLYGTALGHDGQLINASSRFVVASSPFLTTDVGADLRVVREGRVENYIITTYISGTTVAVTPTPQDGATLQWEFRHPVFTDRIRLTGGGYRFTEADVGATVLLGSDTHAHNRGAYRITSIEDPLTASLDTAYGLIDEAGVSWKLSHTGLQHVVTQRGRYAVPLGVPVREDIKAATSVGVLTFKAFEAVTNAFRVVDYLEDPKWWHRVTIPEELMQGSGARRTVTPELIEHVYGALDDAHYGDEGLYYGCDDEGRPSPPRAGMAIWYGGDRVVMSFPVGTAGARPRDVGQHLVVREAPFAGHFKVLAVEADGVTLKLDRFPPPEADEVVPPRTFNAELPPLIYRRTVAFVLMDRALKYHSVRVTVDPSVGLSTELLEDTLRVVRTAKPSHIFLFFDTLTNFRDELPLTEELVMGLDHHLTDEVTCPDAQITYATTSLLRYGDCYRFTTRTASITPSPGVPQTLPTTLPTGVTAVRTLVKVAFALDARVGARRPVEGLDYVVDYVAGTVTVLSGVSITPDPVIVTYVDCIRRVLTPSDPHDPGETALAYGGTDPTFVRQAGAAPDAVGLVDRAVQLTLGS